MVKTKSSVQQLHLSKNAITVLEKRYLKRDRDGKAFEKPEKMFQRVATAIAPAELSFAPDADVTPLAGKFYDMMVNWSSSPIRLR